MSSGLWAMIVGFVLLIAAPVISLTGSSHEIITATGVSFVAGLFLFIGGYVADKLTHG